MKKQKHVAAHRRRRDRKNFSRQEGNNLKRRTTALEEAMQKIGRDLEVFQANTENVFRELRRALKRGRKNFIKGMNRR